MVKRLLAALLFFALPAFAQVRPIGAYALDGSDGSGWGSVTTVGNGTIGPLLSGSWATATTTPAFSLNFSAQAANCLMAGPVSGGNAVPTCRAAVALDLGTALSPTFASVNISQSISGSKTTAFTSASAVAVNFADIAVASNSSTSGEVGFEVELSDGTDFSVLRGRFAYTATNKAGTLAVNSAPTVFGSENAASALGGTIAATATVTTGTNLIHLNIVPAWTVITPTTKHVNWRIDSTQTNVITAN